MEKRRRFSHTNQMVNTLRVIYYEIIGFGRFAVGSVHSVGTFEREMN